MPGPALTVSVNGDTSGLDAALSGATSGGGIGAFARNAMDLVTSMGGVTGIVTGLADGLHALVDLGGPEAQAAMSELDSTLSEGLAPVMEDLGPLIADMVEGLTELMKAVLPVLVPLLQGLVGVLGFLFQAVNQVFTVLNDLWQKVIQPLVDTVLQGLWEKLDAIRGMFDLVWTAVNNVVGIIRDVLAGAIDTIMGPLQGFLDLVGQAIDALAELFKGRQDLAELAASEGTSTEIPGRSAPAMAGARITINTGADPGAVVRSIRRYSAANGGGRAFARNVTRARAH